MAIFILFPLVATIAIAFTNYSGSNQLSFERAVSVLTEQRYFAGDKYQFTLYPQADNKYQIALTNPTTEQTFVSEPISLATGTNVVVTEQNRPTGEVALKVITQNRAALQSMKVVLPNNNELTMSSLRQFSEQKPRYQFDEENKILLNNETGKRYQANDETGFFQSIDENGHWQSETLEPGYTVTSGFNNFIKIFTDEGIQNLLSKYLFGR